MEIHRSLTALFAGLCLICATEVARGQSVITGNVNYDFLTDSTLTWTLNGNTTVQPQTAPYVFDQFIGNPNNTLSIANGADFQIVFGQNVDLANSFWNTNQSWLVFDNFNPGRSTGVFDLIAPGALQTFRPGSSFTITPVTNKQVTLTYNAASFVPEPSTALAGVLLACGLLRRRRA